MPRGSPKRVFPVRLQPALVEEVKRHTGSLTAAIEAGLAMWLTPLRQAEAEVKRKPAPERAGEAGR
jgi:hypothetical protein